MQTSKPIIVTIMLLGLLCPMAHAGTAEKKEKIQVENLVVTAQKKEENMQQVPISMDVFSETDLEDAKIETTYDLVKFSPNVHIKESYVEHAIVIRGISSFAGSLYSPAGYYVDGISYPLHYMQNTGLLDIERTEVLKGPQGTLYGSNSESGVVNIITRQPDNAFQGKIISEIREYDTFKAGTSISGPVIKDKLYLGGSFQYEISDGYYENEITGSDTVNDRDHKNGRATLRWTPGDQWDISFIADMMKNDDHGGGYRFLTGPHKTDRFEIRKDNPCDEYIDQDENSQALRIKYKGDTFDVVSATSALHQTIDKQNEMNFWVPPKFKKCNIFKIKEEMLSQEFRVSSSTDGPFDWLAGLYGFTEKTNVDFNVFAKANNMAIQHPETDIETRGYALFGQGTYRFFDKFHITAGLRLDHLDLEGEFADTVKGISLQQDMSNDEVLPKLSAGYDISKDVMLYGSVSKGYLSGGYNFMNQSTDSFHYDPEYTWNYESGIKTSWLANRLMANLSIFYIEIEDKQVADMDISTHVTTISNAGEAHSSGLELQFKAKPVQGLDLFAGFGYNASKFDKYTATVKNGPTGTMQDLKNNSLPYAPEYTYNAGIQFRSANHFFYRADIFGTDKFYGNAANDCKQDGYQTVNLTIGYESNAFDIYLWAKNIFDEEYSTWIVAVGQDTMGRDGAPQTFGLTASYRF